MHGRGVCMAGGAWQGACMAGDVHGQGACMAGGHAWWGAYMVGACIAGGVRGRGHAWQGVVCVAGGMHDMECVLVPTRNYFNAKFPV